MDAPSAGWQLRHDPLSPDQLRGVPELTPIQVQLLANRGVSDPATMGAWVRADASLVSAPRLLPDCDRAVERMRHAIKTGEMIGIVGDCDVDGLTATALLMETLTHLGANLLRPFIAPRKDDGRGLTLAAVDYLRTNGAQLCVTVDNGSSSVEEVALLKASGIETIITDHHHIPETPPDAYALVNPQRADSVYPHPEISGAGVAFQVARALCDDAPLDDERIIRIIDLAGMGTLADVVTLSPENHTLVARGVAQIITQPRPGLRALFETQRLSITRLTARDLAYHIGPRLNSAGRLGDPLVALDLLLATDSECAAALASTLIEWNVERQQLTEVMFREADEQARPQIAAGDSIIFVAQAGWSMGMVGLVAGRLSDTYDRLAVVVALGDDACRASLRGPRWFHIAETLASLGPMLSQSGGHAQAGGFTTTADHLDTIRQRFSDAFEEARRQPHTEAATVVEVDARASLNRINNDLMDQVRALAPFGQGFPEPTFVSEGVRVVRAYLVGNNQHLKLLVEQSGNRVAFFWRRGGAQKAAVEALALAGSVDLIWNLPMATVNSDTLPEPLVVAVVAHPR